MQIPFYAQETSWTCGPASMKMALEKLGIRKEEKELARVMKTTKKHGTDHKYFATAAKKFKLAFRVKTNSSLKNVKELLDDGWLVIINYFDEREKEGHYAVAVRVEKNKLFINDPWNKKGKNVCFSGKKFESIWYDEEGETGWLFAVKK